MDEGKWYTIYRGADGLVAGFILDEHCKPMVEDTKAEMKEVMSGHILEGHCEYLNL